MPHLGDSHGLQILVISVAALLMGPLIHRLARRAQSTMVALDSFVLVAVVGLVLLEITPRALALAGWPAFVALALGLAGPAIAEGPLRLAAGGTHRAALALASIGMALHSFTDGLALAAAHADGEGSHGMEVAVIAHQLPVAVAVWWLLRPAGALAASAAMALLAAATVAGFLLADASLAVLDARWLGLFQAAVGGLLLHVVAHRSFGTASGRGARVAAGLGALLGMLLLAALAHDGHGDEDPLVRTLAALHELARESAPALLLAYALAGLVAGLVPEAPVRWLRRGGPAGQSLRGMAIGLPLPLCSCGVVPVYRTLLDRGVPAAGAMAFLVATPELGLDAVLLSLPLLGEEMTLVRLVAAALVAWVIGWAVGGAADRAGSVPPASPPTSPTETLLGRVVAGLRTGFGELVDTTAPWIAFGLLLAALIEPWIDPAALTAVPAAAQVAIFAVLGVPMYVCASGATPLVAALLAKGLSPGAALAFLLTGPATNATTFGLLTRLHGRATALRFAAAMTGLAIALGLLVDALLPGLRGVAGVQHDHADGGLFADLALWALVGLFLASLARQGPQGFVAHLWGHDHAGESCSEGHGAKDGCGHAHHDHHGHGHGHAHAHHDHAHHDHEHGHAHHGHAHHDDHAHHGHAHHERGPGRDHEHP